MLNRFARHEDNYAFSDLNPSIIGQKVIVRSQLNESTDLAALIVVSTYEVVKGTDVDAPLFYCFNGDDQFIFRENDRFVILEDPEAGFGKFYFDFRYALSAIKVGNAGVDLVGNNVTFSNYKDQNGLRRNESITGRVILVSKNGEEYSIVLGSEGMDKKIMIRLDSTDEVIV